MHNSVNHLKHMAISIRTDSQQFLWFPKSESSGRCFDTFGFIAGGNGEHSA